MTTASISPKRVGSRQAAYLSVGLPANTTIYGVTVEWTPIDP